MKVLTALSVGLQVVAAKVSYEGYKVYHVETSDYEATQSALSDIEYVSLNCESDHKTLEVAVAPESLKAFEELGLDAKLTVEDLGVDIAAEGGVKPYEGMYQSNYTARLSLQGTVRIDAMPQRDQSAETPALVFQTFPTSTATTCSRNTSTTSMTSKRPSSATPRHSLLASRSRVARSRASTSGARMVRV